MRFTLGDNGKGIELAISYNDTYTLIYNIVSKRLDIWGPTGSVGWINFN